MRDTTIYTPAFPTGREALPVLLVIISDDDGTEGIKALAEAHLKKYGRFPGLDAVQAVPHADLIGGIFDDQDKKQEFAGIVVTFQGSPEGIRELIMKRFPYFPLPVVVCPVGELGHFERSVEHIYVDTRYRRVELHIATVVSGKIEMERSNFNNGIKTALAPV